MIRTSYFSNIRVALRCRLYQYVKKRFCGGAVDATALSQRHSLTMLLPLLTINTGMATTPLLYDTIMTANTAVVLHDYFEHVIIGILLTRLTGWGGPSPQYTAKQQGRSSIPVHSTYPISLTKV